MHKRSLVFYFAAGMLLVVTVSSPAETATAGRLRAGAAKIDITPKQSELTVATDSIRDHLFARAILVDDGTTCAALV
jgi:neutral ceramidase